MNKIIVACCVFLYAFSLSAMQQTEGTRDRRLKINHREIARQERARKLSGDNNPSIEPVADQEIDQDEAQRMFDAVEGLSDLKNIVIHNHQLSPLEEAMFKNKDFKIMFHMFMQN